MKVHPLRVELNLKFYASCNNIGVHFLFQHTKKKHICTERIGTYIHVTARQKVMCVHILTKILTNGILFVTSIE